MGYPTPPFLQKFRENAKREARIRKMNEEGHDGYDWYEGQTRWPVTRIVEVAFGVISLVIWAIILFRIFTSGNGEFEKMILLNEKADAVYPLAQNEVMRIHSETSDQEDGSVLIYYPVYLEEVENLQFTARVRRKALPPGKGETGYTFILRETGEEGTVYHKLSYFAQERNLFYTFFRLCFEGITWEEDSVYTFLVYEGGYEPADGETYPPSESKFSFVIANSDTYCNITVPKADVYERSF